MPVPVPRPPILIPTGVSALLGGLVHERVGIYFAPDQLDVLLEKIGPLVERRGCRSYLDYYYLLKYEANGREDWVQVMDALSVQETYFWREMDQIHGFVQDVVPAWFKRTSTPLRIWCAASATGEEPYSIVMALNEAGWENHPIEVTASDGSLSALERARGGLYRERAFRVLPADLRNKYFSREGDLWKIRAELARRVTFQRANLMAAEEIGPLAHVPVIFCRNVFIYFSPHAVRQTVAVFASRMPARGHLFVGAAESLLKMTADFQLKEIGNAFVYVRI